MEKANKSMEHYVKSAAVYRNHQLRHTLSHAYLGDTSGVRYQLADEIEAIERRLNDLVREGDSLDLEMIHTFREMLYARHKLFKELS